MSSQLPSLIIQPRRLGDLILTFPLVADLSLRNPGQPIWIAGEKAFFQELMPFAPRAAFFPAAHLPLLAKREYQTVINLGSDAIAADCAGQCQAQLKLGRSLTGGKLRINGFWQLYRESLTHNNYHNLFHWADLFRLDLGPSLTKLARPEPKAAASGRIGLFIGASEASKRPQPQFWAALANQLAQAGLKPVLLGGPGEADLACAIMARKPAAINFCGKTSLGQLAAIMATLDLLVTPDTGPMHLADWLGVPVLNLSMGNVSAYETGPLSEGQHVVTAAISCYGCWGCRHKALLCHNEFKAAKIARIATNLARRKKPEKTTGLTLYETGRDQDNLYTLSGDTESAASQLSRFWQAAFLAFGHATPERLAAFRRQASQLCASHEQLAGHIRANFGKMLVALARASKSRAALPASFWTSQPRHSRLFAGNLHMGLQNEDYAPAAFRQALERIELVQNALTGPIPH